MTHAQMVGPHTELMQQITLASGGIAHATAAQINAWLASGRLSKEGVLKPLKIQIVPSEAYAIVLGGSGKTTRRSSPILFRKWEQGDVLFPGKAVPHDGTLYCTPDFPAEIAVVLSEREL